MKVVMLPWLAYGHITPFLELAKRLSDRNIHTYICSTPINLSFIENKISENYCNSIHLVQLHLPTSPELPPHYHTTNGLPVHLNAALAEALNSSKQKISDILKTLQPDLLIHDILLPLAAGVALLNNIPTISFATSGAAATSYIVHCLVRSEIEYPFPAIKLTDFEQEMMCGVLASTRERGKSEKVAASQTLLVKTSRKIEGKYVDNLSQVMKKKTLPVGLLVCADHRDHNNEDIELMEWLGGKDEFSTIYLSFGSEYFLCKEEIEEIALGLELSNVNFIWVLRSPVGDKTRVLEILPQGFVDRVGERGKIVEKWAPQVKILRHSSTSAFVTHCGWNSILESIEFGVPIIAMPMHLDQPLNARLAVEIGVGVEVNRDEKGKFRKEEIGRVIREVVVGKVGESLRRKVREERESLRAIGDEEMDVVVQELARVCGKSSTLGSDDFNLKSTS